MMIEGARNEIKEECKGQAGPPVAS